MAKVNWSVVLPRLFGEFAIIFVGVVMALQFESWRDNSLSASREETQLRALRVDLDRNREVLDNRVRRQRQVFDAANILLAQYGPTSDALSPDSIGNLHGWAISAYRFPPVTGAYDALVASGEIDLLRSEELRRLLAQYHAGLAAGFADDDVEFGLKLQLLAETKSELLALWAPEGSYDPANPSWANGPVPLAAARALLTNQDFAGLLVMKIQYASNRLRRLEGLADRTQELIQMLDAELLRF